MHGQGQIGHFDVWADNVVKQKLIIAKWSANTVQVAAGPALLRQSDTLCRRAASLQGPLRRFKTDIVPTLAEPRHPGLHMSQGLAFVHQP